MKHPRRSIAALSATGLVAAALVAGAVATAPAASAAPVSVTGASLAWAINDEVNAGAFAPGTWNLMSAGKIGNPGAGGTTLRTADSGATWSNGRPAGWKAVDGNVTIEDKQSNGSYAPTTFQGTRTNSVGQTTSGNSTTILAETRLALKNGTGTVDPTAGTASISWDGDATVLFYSGMTYFTLSDPRLTVEADGDATLTATAGGYATSMNDPTAWTALPDTVVTLATMSGVDVSGDSFTSTPAYREVTYDARANETEQNRTAATWGAFPTDFIHFQQTVGQGPYWYSTGGSADPRKPAQPLTVDLGRVTPSETSLFPTGAQQITVTGAGFDPSAPAATGTRPPLAGRPGGVYVVFGKFATTWRPSTNAPSATRRNSSQKWAVLAQDMATIGGEAGGAVELRPDGSFSTTLTIDKAAIDAVATDPSLVNYGIYTYAGSGATARSYETYTPITFDKTESVTAPPATTPVATTPSTTTPSTTTPTAAAVTSTSTALKLAKKPTTRSAGKLRVSVAGATTGTVAVTLRTAKGTKVKAQKKRAAVRNGVATITVPKLAAGRYTVVVRYAATSTTAASTKKMTIRVR